MTLPTSPLSLWPEGHLLADDMPTLTAYPAAPDIATGAAFIICPGGGYARLADHEGAPVAQWLAGLGITSFVLRYRLGPRHRHPAMLDDAAQSVRLLRANAGKWGLDPARVGIMGFSAGGHLASTVSTHFDAGDANASDAVHRQSSRPDAAVLIYPVISLKDPLAHAGSRWHLLGATPHESLVALLSNEAHVTAKTPPTFLVHTADDGPVPCENSLLYALALRRAGVDCELHLYAHGEHGFGMGSGDPILSTWPGHCARWLETLGFSAPAPSAIGAESQPPPAAL